MTKVANDIEAHRAFWANVARENGWYTQPFYVQVWQKEDGTITDSVATTALTGDVVVWQGDDFICPVCDQERPFEDGSGDCRACIDCCECIGNTAEEGYCMPY